MDGVFYDNRPLLMDVDGQIVQFLNEWLDPSWATECPASIAVDSRSEPCGDAKAGVRLPRPNYPPRPRVGINQLYWPTGAARWAQGHFLCGEADAARFRRRAYGPHGTGNAPLTLKVVYSGTSITTSMYMLAPRPCTSFTGDRLLLLTLVDHRYFWQFTGLGAAPTGRPLPSSPPGPVSLSREGTWSTWDDVLDDIADTLGITLDVDDYSASYLNPDPEEMTRHFENVAVMLDAAAHSLGLRVVRALDGTVKLINRTTSDARVTDNLKGNWALIAGDAWEYGPDTSRLLIAFPKVIQGHLDAVDRFHWVEVAHSSPIPSTDGLVQTIDPTCHTWEEAYAPEQQDGTLGVSDVVYTTCHASFDGAQDTCPTNDSSVQSLAKQIYRDYFGYRCADGRDMTFAGVKPWMQSGYDDFLLFDFGTEGQANTVLNWVPPNESKEPPPPPTISTERVSKITTRTRTMPQTFGVRHQLSQDSSVVLVNEPWFRMVSQESITALHPGQSAGFEYVMIDDMGAAVGHDPPLDVDVHDPIGQACVLDNEVVRAEWSPERRRWEPAHQHGLIRRGTVSESGGISAGSHGEVTLSEDTDITVDAYFDWAEGVAGLDELQEVFVEYFTTEKSWRVIGADIGGGGDFQDVAQIEIATLTGTLAYGGSTTATISGGDSVTVYDWCLSSGQTVASGKKVVLGYRMTDSKWYVIAAQCG